MRQLKAGSRKLELEHLTQADIAAFTPEAGDVPGIRSAADVNREEVEKIPARSCRRKHSKRGLIRLLAFSCDARVPQREGLDRIRAWGIDLRGSLVIMAPPFGGNCQCRNAEWHISRSFGRGR